DLNAKIRCEEFHLRQTGKHSLHDESNENDLRVVNFVASKNGGDNTMFLRKNIYKYTWVSSD
ncbi:hypothetical protein EAG_08855, partial [Camponotus floridanus]